MVVLCLGPAAFLTFPIPPLLPHVRMVDLDGLSRWCMVGVRNVPVFSILVCQCYCTCAGVEDGTEKKNLKTGSQGDGGVSDSVCSHCVLLQS